jgi:hypothetical protein
MKLSQTLTVLAFATMMALTATAQEIDASRVKILPSSDNKIIKVLFAMQTDDVVDVKFFSDGGMVKRDKITGPFEKGVMKRYDVSEINSRDYWIEVTSGCLKVTYRVRPDRRGKSFSPQLESATFTNLVAAKK